MPLDAGSVYATLGGKFSPSGFAQFDAAMKKSVASAEKSEAAIARSQRRMGAGSAAMGTAATAAAAVVAAGLFKSVQAAQRFEKQMSEVQAVTKAGAKQMDVMKQAALDLGAKTGIGATQAAKGLTELAKGGMSAKQSTDALVGTIALAQAGNMDLSDAASTVVQSLSTFNLRAGDATRVADGLASAANKTTMDVGDFAQALAQGGVVAQAAGFDFDQTLNVLGAMANRFRSGSDMGTSFKTAILALANPSKKAAEEMKRLNIDLFDHEGKAKSAAEVVKMLGDRFDGMSRKQRIASAGMIAGSDSARTLLALASAPQGAGNVREVGSAADTAKAKMDNLAGSWQKLKGEAETAAIGIGQELTPALKDAADAAADFINGARTGQGAGGFFADLAKGAGKLVEMNWDALSQGVKSGKYLFDFLRGADQSKQIRVTAKLADQVTPGLVKIAGTKLAPKVQRILGNDSSVQAKIKALRGLGINGPTARFLAQTGSVEAAIAAVVGRSVTIPVNFKAQPFRATPPGRAAGRGPGAHEAALVGEGGGPEWVGNQRDGWGMVSKPTILGLGPDDYVIPTEQRHRGRALGLLASAFGIDGFAKGKKPKTAGKKKQAQQDQRIQNAGTQADTADTRMQQAEDARRAGAFEKQKKAKLAALTRERSRIKAAIKTSKGSRKIALNNQLARVEADIQSTKLEQYEPRALPDFGTQGRGLAENVTAEVQRWLDDFDMRIGLAQIDTPNDPSDDRAALVGKRDYLARTLAKARANPSLYGGASAVAQLASEMTSTTRAITELDAPTIDQQAVADQQYQRGLAAGQTSFIDRLTAATIQGAAPSLVIQSYVPPSPSEARRLADYAVGGIDFQGGRPASTQRIGV